MSCADEFELLTAFWDVAKHYDNVVTFNGRGFDVPFILSPLGAAQRAHLEKKLARLSLRGRTALRPGGTIYVLRCERARRRGAAVQPGFLLQGVGIESPKSHGVTGMDVNTLMAEGKFREIAEYCLRDVRATVEPYRIWKERLAGIK